MREGREEEEADTGVKMDDEEEGSEIRSDALSMMHDERERERE